jgi:membrane-associated phospholipid phosphatase
VSEPAEAATQDEVPHRRARQLLALALICVVLCALVYLVMVRTTAGQRADNDALEGRSDRARVQEATGNLLQTVSIASIVIIGSACVAVALVRRNPLVAAGVVILIGGANVTTQFLKEKLPSDDLISNPILPGNSYPSGHTTVAISLAIAMVLVAPPVSRGIVAAFGTAYAALIGAGTVTSGWHYPSDPVGAYLVTVGWGAAIAAAILIVRGRARRRRHRLDDAPIVGPVFAVVGIGLLTLTFLAIAATAIALQSGRLDAVDVTRVYGLSLLAIVGSVSLLVAAMLFCMRGVRLERPEHLHHHASA